MRYLIVGLWLVSAAGTLRADEAPRPVRVGGGYSVPWSYLGPDGRATGFYVEVMREAARREGLPFQAVFPKGGPGKSLREGEIDLWTAAVPTDERRKELYFTQPWWSQDHYLGVLAEGPIQGVGDLEGRTVVYSTSPPFTVDLESVFPGAVLKPMNDMRSRFRAVCAGTADALLFYHETSLFAVTGSNEMAQCRERGLRLIPVGRPVMEVAIAALPANQALADRFRERIRQMSEDQTLARLAEFPLTGNENVARMLQAQTTSYRERVVRVAQLGAGLLLLLGVAAHWRLRRANRRTREALAVAESALQAKREFLATLSHEIRTPMTAVLGYMDMLKGTPLRHDQRRFATEVTHATETLLTLMTTLLSYGKPGQMTAAGGEETMDPAGVLDDCVATVLLAAENKGLEMTACVDPSVPRRVHGDAVRLRQAVLNLLNNAVKFTEEGSVRMRAEYTGGVLICEVSDTGPGIPEEKRRAIFEPFTQLDSTDTREFGGVGLGLAVVADISRQLGGEVGVEDGEGGGARFRLRIPYRRVDGEPGWLEARAKGAAALLDSGGEAARILAEYLRAAGMEVARFETAEALESWRPPDDGPILLFIEGPEFETAAPSWQYARTTRLLMGRMAFLREADEKRKAQYDDVLPLPAATRSVREILFPEAPAQRELAPVRCHVLVVDDNAVNRRVFCALLEKLGCQVEVACNGREAVEASCRARYTLILMDCQMPVMSGYEAAAEIRSRQLPGEEVPICGISASLDEETRLRCEASGMNEYLPKPVTLDMLHDLLTRTAARQLIEEKLQGTG